MTNDDSNRDRDDSLLLMQALKSTRATLMDQRKEQDLTDESTDARLERLETDLTINAIDSATLSEQQRLLVASVRKLADAVSADFKRVTEHLNKLVDSHNKVTAVLDAVLNDYNDGVLDAEFTDLPGLDTGLVSRKSEGEGNN